MKKIIKGFALLAAATLVLSTASMVFAGDQLQQKDQIKDQKKDGTCQEYVDDTAYDRTLASNDGEKGYDTDNGKGDQDKTRDC